MAKTRNMPTGADTNLISAASYGAKLSSGQGMGSGAAAVLQSAQGMQPDIDYRKQLRKQAEATMGNFIDNMPANIDIAKVPQSMRPQLGKHLIEMKNEYFENAKLASSNSPNSPIYMEAVDRMNDITTSFANLNADFERLKEMKYQAIEDFDNGMISEGNKPEDIDFISKLATDQVQFQIGAGGRLVYGEGATLDDVPKYHYKDHETATKILELSNTLYGAGMPMDKGREQIVRMQLQQQIKKGGRDAVLSMATDDHIIPGGLGIQDIDLLENPERQEELEQFVINSYMDVLRGSAQSGFNAQQSKLNRAEKRAMDKAIELAELKKEKGLTSTGEMTAAERREIDATDRAGLANNYMQEVMQGNTNSLIGGSYAGENIVGASFVGANGADARRALEEAGFSNADIRDFEAYPDEMLIITDKSYYVVDPFDESVNKDLSRAIITNKFGNDATTDAAIMKVEQSKPVLPVINIGPMPAGQ